ncbi:adenosylcobinamide-phosphate synthase CbiB [Tabrizicola oligotrophica]|uniref:Cobalamin biosynthesis protein CobD n=1 Tax=Tabrizicola oligotrophica TaxID=2710650 RepID=A0A6M0QQK0_9RHOB|nr:adenosylcobinamide-phosphate synthase CbiB [Tabrizicola oligotrophica]NEY89606.1 cobalamin biosynthesis protein [Tabrizicola oligotrophica]
MSATLLIPALLLDAALGEPKLIWDRYPHPAVLMGRLVGWCDRRFNNGATLRLKGVAVMAALAMMAVVLGWLIHCLPDFGIVEVLVAAILLAQKSLVQHVGAVAAGLRQSLKDGQRAVAMIVGRDTAVLDRSGVSRSAIESAAENLSDGVIAPAFWFLVGGLPGLLLYKITNTADSMIGHMTPRHREFGWAAARFDDLLNLIPARLSALLIALTNGWTDPKPILRDAPLHRSPNAGWPEAAVACVQGIALSGPRSYHGQMADYPWVYPEGRRDLRPKDIDRTITTLWRAWGGMLGLAVVVAVLA